MRVRIVATSCALFAWVLSTAACGGGATVTSVAIVSPSQTAYTNDAIDITVETRGGSGAVKLYVDGEFLAKAPGGEYTWDTTAVPEGPHSVHATFSGSRSDPVQVVVDRTAPRVIARFPSHGDDNASTSGVIGALFDEAMDPLSGVPSAFVFEIDGVAVTGTVATTGNTVAFLPASPLPAPADGTVRLSALTDLAGNALASEDWSFFFPGWERLSNQLDTVPSNPGYNPNVAVDSLGRLVVTWIELDDADATGTYLAYARRWNGTAWEALGGALNTDPQRSIFVTNTAVDGQDRPLAAFYEEELPGAGVANVYVRRWSGTAWETLGGGPLDRVVTSNTRQIAIAVGPDDGEPRVSFLENNGVDVRMHVLRWTGTAWTEYGAGFVTSYYWAPNGLAVDPAGNPVVAWRDIASDLRVSRWDGAGFVAVGGVLDVLATEVPDGPSVVISSSGAITIAWNETDPTYGSGVNAYVGRFETVSSPFVRLGDALDMDISLDAYYPDLALAPDGTLAVAWGEYDFGVGISAAYIARWTGTRWQPIGPELGKGGGINYPQLAMDADNRPVVGWNTFSYPDYLVADAIVSRFNSDIVPSGLGRLAANDGSCVVPTGAGVPATLTATGCFFGFPPQVPDPALVPYELNSPLWSDAAEKRRWFLLPEGSAVTVNQVGAWTWPIGTMFFKEFAYDRIKGDPSTRFPLETRILVLRDAATVEGYSYKWREDGTNADLLPDTPSIETYDLIDNGVLVVDTHSFPSRGQCNSCHLSNAGFFLGPITANLNRNADYGHTIDNQLRAMEDAGLFSADVADAGTLDRIPRPKDPARPLLDRVKGYAAANCAHCHRPGGLGALADFVWETPLAAMNICVDDVVVGDSANSFLYQRVNASFGQTVPATPMPPLARRRVDPLSAQLIFNWIDGLAACP